MQNVTIDELKQFVHTKENAIKIADDLFQKAPDYKEYNPSYICPNCNNGSGVDGTGIHFLQDKADLKCFKCGEYGDLFSWVGIQNNLDNTKDFYKICEIIADNQGMEISKPKENTEKKNRPIQQTIKEYIYTDENNTPIFKKIRYRLIDQETGEIKDPKRFKGYDLKNDNYKLDNLTDEEKSLIYNRPIIKKAKEKNNTVYFVEGEKDADTLTKLGYCATTIYETTKGITKYHIDQLRGIKELVIIPDNDEHGKKFSTKAFTILKPFIDKVYITSWSSQAPLKFDVTDFLEDKEDKIKAFNEYIEQTKRDNLQVFEKEEEEKKQEKLELLYKESREYLNNGNKGKDPDKLTISNGVIVSKLIIASLKVPRYAKVKDIAINNAKGFYMDKSGGRFYLYYDIFDKPEIIETDSDLFIRRMVNLSEKAYPDEIFTKDDIKKAKISIQSHIEEIGEKRDIFQRIAVIEKDKKKTIYIDLYNENSEVVKIDSLGFSIITKEQAPVLFKTNDDMEELPKPIYRPDKQDYKKLFDCFLTDKEDTYILISYILACYRPDLELPQLSLSGEPGNGKSEHTRMIRDLVDPSKTKDILSPSNANKTDFPIMKDNQYMLCIDNLSYIDKDFSNIICLCATGGSYPMRKLYTNTETITVNLKGPLILNGISEVAKETDLVDRTLFINLPLLTDEKRNKKENYKEVFKENQAYILGSLYNALSVGLKKEEEKTEVPITKNSRLLKYFKFSYRCFSTFEIGSDGFKEVYKRNKEITTENTILNNPFIDNIITIMTHYKDYFKTVYWIESKQGILNQIDYKGLSNYEDRESNIYPKANKMGDRLKRDNRLLTQKNISYNLKADLRTKKERFIVLKYENKLADNDKVACIYPHPLNRKPDIYNQNEDRNEREIKENKKRLELYKKYLGDNKFYNVELLSDEFENIE